MQVRIHSRKEAVVLITMAVAAGRRICAPFTTPEELVDADGGWSSYPCVRLRSDEVTMSLPNSDSTIGEFIAELLKEGVKLNDSYTATREGDLIVAGDVSIPVAKVKEVYETLCI